MKRAIRILLLVLLIVVAGCSKSGLKLVRVQGKLALDGQPLAGKHVQFEPVDGTGGLGGGANTDAAGNYDVIAIVGGSLVDQMGLRPGKYKVTVTEPMFPMNTERTVQGELSEADVAIGLPVEKPRITRAKVAIPAKYGEIESTPLAVTVPETSVTINLELVSQR